MPSIVYVNFHLGSVLSGWSLYYTFLLLCVYGVCDNKITQIFSYYILQGKVRYPGLTIKGKLNQIYFEVKDLNII